MPLPRFKALLSFELSTIATFTTFTFTCKHQKSLIHNLTVISVYRSDSDTVKMTNAVDIVLMQSDVGLIASVVGVHDGASYTRVSQTK